MKIFMNVLIALFFIFTIIKIYRKQKRAQDKYIVNLVVFSKMWLLFAVVFFVLYMIFDCIVIRFLKQNPIVDIVLLALTAFFCILSVMFCRWHIDMNDKGMEYCFLLGKTHYRYFDRMTKVEIDGKDNVYIYSEDEKVLKVPVEIGLEYFIHELKYHGVRVDYKYNMNHFVMKLPLFYPVLYLCFFIIVGVFAVCLVKLGHLKLDHLKLEHLAGILFWAVMELCLIAKTISDFLYNVMIDGNSIVQVRFLRKKRKIDYKQIIRVMHREKDNAPYLYIYSEKGLEMKINMLCENSRLLEELVKKHRWEDQNMVVIDNTL